MKILLINNGKGWSGGQEHLKDLAVELRNNGVEVHFLVREDTVNETRFAELGFTVHLMPYKYGWNYAAVFFNLVAMLRRERFDIVSINREHDLALAVVAYRCAFPFGSPGRLMMSYHLPTDHYQLLLSAVDAIVCISEHVQTKLLRRCPAMASRTAILYYGITLPPPPEPSKFTTDRPHRYLKNVSFPTIGMVGEFWKNQIEMIEMLPQLKQDFPEISLVFIGNNAARDLVEPLEARARELGVENNIFFTGLVPRQQIQNVFYDLDLSVTTHRNEGFGIVHLESLAAGTPVVAFNEGGFVDIFKGEDVGVIIDGGTVDFAAATGALLMNNERRFNMGRAGYSLIEQRYTIKVMGQTYLDFYRTLLGSTTA